MTYQSQTEWQKYSGKKHKYSILFPKEWQRMIKESPTGDSVVIYNENKNLVRFVISNNNENKQFIGNMIGSPFKSNILTDSGLHGNLSIGTNKNAKDRVLAWFYVDHGGFTYHMIADMDTGFAVENKDLLVNVAKSFAV